MIRFKARNVFILVIICFATKTKAQDCLVKSDALKGKYDGGCEDGKAEGKGKATGMDSYDGEFKGGLPNGEGVYTWANGNIYDGHWAKGKREGKGLMHYKTAGGDSMVNGYWKRDEYIGLYENAFEIINKGRANVEVRQVKDGRNEINLTAIQTQNTGAPVPQPVLSYVNVVNGFYANREDYIMNNSNQYSFKQVTYPFRAKFIFSQSMREVEIEFFNPGSYTVEIKYID